MKRSNSETFGQYLNKYLSVYLPGHRGLSVNSIMSYRDTFSLLIAFLKTEKQLVPERLPMSFLTKDLIVEFADWLENERGRRLRRENEENAEKRDDLSFYGCHVQSALTTGFFHE